MLRLVRSGTTVFWRHLRNARGRPDRLWWIARRSIALLVGRGVGDMLRRNADHAGDPEAYARWIARYDTLDDEQRMRLLERAGALAHAPCFTIMLYGEGTAAEREATLASLQRQLYTNWRIVPTRAPADAFAASTSGAPDTIATGAGCELDQAEFAIAVAPGDRLSEDCLLRVAEAHNRWPGAAVIYGDQDELDVAGRRMEPWFKPDWNPEWLRTEDYVGEACFMACRHRDVAGAPGVSVPDVHVRTGRSTLPDVRGHVAVTRWARVLAVSEAGGPGSIVHVPQVLYHRNATRPRDAIPESDRDAIIGAMLARRAIAADTERGERGVQIRYALPAPPPRVSVVIPTRDQADLLGRCVDSLRRRTRYPDVEIVIVDNDSRQAAAVRLLEHWSASGVARVLRFPGSFNFSAECNAGVAAATGEVIVLLNNDTEVIQEDWVDHLVGHALQRDVAFTGALLLYPDRTIQHAGLVVGANGIGQHRFRGYRLDDPRIGRWIACAQNISAVTAACTAIRKDRYEAIGGFDERLAVANNDVDFCLRALAKGYRNVWTPHAVLVHDESVSRGYENTPEQQRRLSQESTIMRSRWRCFLDDDPAYNPNLTLDGPPYDLAFPPRIRWPAGRAVSDDSVAESSDAGDV
jgi:GT2 family glycosyltransferase